MKNDKVVSEYNPFDPTFYTNDPWGTYSWMRNEQPVYHSKEWGWYALTRFDDVAMAALDSDTFRNFEGMDIDATGEQTNAGNFAYMDNPRHDQVRRIVQPFFQPAAVAKRSHPIRQAVRDLVDQWKDKGAVDIAQELAWPLPFDVFFNLLGLPSVHDEKFAQLEKWTHQLKHREPNSPELTPISKAAAANIRDYFKELIEDRRKNPSDDLLTHIVNAEIEGKPFVQGEVTEDSEVLGLLTLLFLGGVESTAGLIGSVFKLLGENPDQRALVLADPSRVSDAIEETLRWSSPLQETARTAIRDVELHGTTIPAGSRVVLVTGAANRDDRQFENPDKFDISRGKFRHFGFGEGLHRCLGAPLARLEASIVLEEVLPLLGEYELSEPATFYPSSPNMYVWKNVPIRFNVA
ncbi:MAG: hypothetical protein RIS82_915 [Actinomycetota bacterium]